VVPDHAFKKNPLPVTRIRQVESLHLILIQHAVQAAVMCAPLKLMTAHSLEPTVHGVISASCASLMSRARAAT